MHASPAAFRRTLVFGPMPGSHLLGKGWRNAASPPAGTSLKAAGLFSFDATALTSLLLAMPSLTMILSRCPMALRIVSAISTAGRCRFAVRSK